MNSRAILVVAIVILLGSSHAFAALTLLQTGPTSLEGSLGIPISTTFPARFLGTIATVSPFNGIAHWSMTLNYAEVDEPGGAIELIAWSTDFPIEDYLGMGTQQLATIDLRVVPRDSMPSYEVTASGVGSMSLSSWPVVTFGDSQQFVPQMIGSVPLTFTFPDPAPIPAPSALLLSCLGAGLVRWRMRRART